LLPPWRTLVARSTLNLSPRALIWSAVFEFEDITDAVRRQPIAASRAAVAMPSAEPAERLRRPKRYSTP
jgi:hypothetical protein